MADAMAGIGNILSERQSKEVQRKTTTLMWGEGVSKGHGNQQKEFLVAKTGVM